MHSSIGRSDDLHYQSFSSGSLADVFSQGMTRIGLYGQESRPFSCPLSVQVSSRLPSNTVRLCVSLQNLHAATINASSSRSGWP